MKELNLEFEEHLKKEPEKFDRRLLQKFGLELETSEHISWRLQKENMDGVLKIPKEKRQEILDTFRKGGITIGELGKKFEIDSMVISNLIFYNLGSVHLLNERSV